MTRFLVLLLFLLTGALRGSAADSAANKALFDRTVDRLNFQTMEGVYDARFTRKKFPITLLTRDERRGFKDFNGDAAFEKLFHNYNDEAEKYKSRFGNGPATLAAFEKGLHGILVDANFEFLLAKAARREDRAALVRKLEGTIKQAITQYDASGEPISEARQPDTLANAGVDEDAVATEAPVADAQVNDLNQTAAPTPDAPAPVAAPAKSGGWSEMLALILAVAAAAGVAYLLFVVVPALRAQTQRATETDDLGVMAPAAPDDHLPPTMAEEARHRAVELRFELLADEVDELKGRIRELESRLADALAAPPEDEVFAAPLAEPAVMAYAQPVAYAAPSYATHSEVSPMAAPSYAAPVRDEYGDERGPESRAEEL